MNSTSSAASGSLMNIKRPNLSTLLNGLSKDRMIVSVIVALITLFLMTTLLMPLLSMLVRSLQFAGFQRRLCRAGKLLAIFIEPGINPVHQ